MPPTQWVVARQSITPWGKFSKFVTTEAPVVVNPDTASKKAYSNRGRNPESMNGRAPHTLIRIQPMAVMIKPSFRRRWSFGSGRGSSSIASPTGATIRMLRPRACVSPSR